MGNNNLKLTGFSSYESASDGVRKYTLNHGRQNKRRGAANPNTAYMLIKLGLCVVMCSLVLVLQLIKTPFIEDTLAKIKLAVEDTKETEETLGKLKLVQLPSILEVFAPSGSPIMPVASESFKLSDDGTLATLYTEEDSTVRSTLNGVVKAVSLDATLGGYVIVSHPDDVEIRYYGIDEISVEVGQPITQNSTIGVLGSGALYLSVTRAGRPVDPLEFLGLSIQG